ncbi:alpha-amylase [Candidatus Peregrinibacteria bacterium CG10_big_fil_rev_8_21_14_0_10_55_24]|nr:MAG: alpha-amylase [Candidatus Peregrinibacteria bacterium CG10_big_fil_rev_8_21_14_0_10_55_24]
MPLICLYFQVHQPYRLRDIRITEIGQGKPEYFDAEKNRAIFRKVAEKCYLPANALIEELLRTYPNFSVAYSLSGVFLEQCKEYGPDVLSSFQRLAQTGKVEFLAETYYHSLSSLKSLEEFTEQVHIHAQRIEELFGQRPTVFRNTELIYSNELSQIARLMGFRGILAEGADHLLNGRSPNVPFTPPTFTLPKEIGRVIHQQRQGGKTPEQITVLLKNYRLSDDVAFRFSDRSWVGFPLTSDRFTDWLVQSGGHSINLFMDYETFGEHQWEDTGIFSFLRSLPELWEKRGIRAATPSQVIDLWKEEETPVYDAHHAISWADMERDLSAWQENAIQRSALESLFSLEKAVKERGDSNLLDLWRLLQTSDHFYYMCTKYWSDGDVHKYFSPYDSPYEAYRRFSHALCDLKQRLETPKEKKPARGLLSLLNLTFKQKS